MFSRVSTTSVRDGGFRAGCCSDVDERADEDLRGDEAGSPDVAVQRADVARRLFEVLPRLLDDRAREKLAEGDDARLFQEVDALGAREVEDLLDLLRRAS